MGADSAIEIIQNCTYKDYTEVGNSLDATGLENMLSSITVMKNVNAYRKSVGLSELEVSYKLIAAAIADANYSTKNVEHAQQFDVGENLAWSYRDPCKAWIYQERICLTRLQLPLVRRIFPERTPTTSGMPTRTSSITTVSVIT